MIPLLFNGVKLTQREFHLKNTLVNGQAFNWWKVVPSGESTPMSGDEKNSNISAYLFRGILADRLIDFTVNASDEVMYSVHPAGKTEEEKTAIQGTIVDYLNLQVDLASISEKWAKSDVHFAEAYTRLPGVRLLRQNPFECMISFICSQNNNIPRITKILADIRAKYGEEIPSSSSSSSVAEARKYFSFPSVSSLATASESEFREIGLGYRAPYLVSALQSLQSRGGEEYLLSLRSESNKEKVRESLISFMGIGSKVADCIALFSLDCHALIPVDTHVFQIYNRVYRHSKKAAGAAAKKEKSSTAMNKLKYLEVSQFFKDKFGEYAGWAQQCLFAAELPNFAAAEEELKNKSSKENSKANAAETNKEQTPKKTKTSSLKEKPIVIQKEEGEEVVQHKSTVTTRAGTRKQTRRTS